MLYFILRSLKIRLLSPEFFPVVERKVLLCGGSTEKRFTVIIRNFTCHRK
jgi:hypothetical protein